MAKKKRKLGEVLRERGVVSADDLNRALQEQRVKLTHLGELMLQQKMVKKAELISALSEVCNAPYFDCTSFEISAEVLQTIPATMARRCQALPVGMGETGLVVAMAEPQNLQLIDELRFKTGLAIEPRLAFRSEIAEAIDRHYGPDASGPPEPASATAGDERGMEFISSSAQQRNVEAMREMQAELLQKSKTTPAVLLVASMIRAAAARGASDIHIEPHSSDTSIRFRVDGMLREYKRVPRALQNTVASRIKILSDMDISERRVPQDGRFLVRIGEKRLDLRVSTLPTQYGEKVVMRLLGSEAPLQELEKLGFPNGVAERWKQLLRLPQGMLLVTGPTGSGKSTTLYSSLHLVRKPSINVITVEDPVEYELPGLNQVQVNNKAGLTFANCLRSILRQDPNVIMIGEIRDVETAEIATKAAQTGHLVLSTLHTNDSISALTRLLDLGIPSFQVASSLSGIVAQRLVRRLCKCRRRVTTPAEARAEMMSAGIAEPPETYSVANGCDECDLTGYKGRIGIHELFVPDEAIRGAVRAGKRNEELRALARRNGMKMMHEFALEHVAGGLTTLEEVQRVVPIEHTTRTVCSSCQRELPTSFRFCPFCGQRGTNVADESEPVHALLGHGTARQ